MKRYTYILVIVLLERRKMDWTINSYKILNIYNILITTFHSMLTCNGLIVISTYLAWKIAQTGKSLRRLCNSVLKVLSYFYSKFDLLGVVICRGLQKGQNQVLKIAAYLGLQLRWKVLVSVVEGVIQLVLSLHMST